MRSDEPCALCGKEAGEGGHYTAWDYPIEVHGEDGQLYFGKVRVSLTKPEGSCFCEKCAMQLFRMLGETAGEKTDEQ